MMGGVSTPPDLALERQLRRQHGAFSRSQALRAGFTPRMIDQRIGACRWRRLARGVYAHAAYPASWEQRCMGALLTEPCGVLGGKTAAVVLGLPDFRPGRVHLTVPPGGRRSNGLAQLRRSVLIEPQVVNGFRINSVPLVLVELAGEVTRSRLDGAVEHAVLHHLTSMEAVERWCAVLATSRRRGLAELRTVVGERGDGFVPAESELEAMMFAALDDPRIPPITRQSPFPWAPRDPQRVDGFIEVWGILLEADGRRWHARLQSMENDRIRDQEAVRRGYVPLRFGWTELHQDPHRVREIVIETGARRLSAGPPPRWLS
jgi:hypothetical protein